jgi:hypothetical protein
MPAQQRVRRGQRGDVGKQRTADRLGCLSQHDAFPVGKAQTLIEAFAHDAILG